MSAAGGRVPRARRAAALIAALVAALARAAAQEDHGPHGWCVDPAKSMRRLRDALGFQPAAVLDVGANVGQWTRETRAVWPEATFFMVEGSESHREELERVGAPFKIAVLGNSSRSVTWFENPRAHTGNSLYREATRTFNDGDVREQRRTTLTLDALLLLRSRTQALPPFQFLKLDVQGAELEVLQGAPRTLSAVEVILLETSLLPYNRGAPLAAELVSHLHGLGFGLLDIPELHRWPSGVLFQVDLLFARLGSPIWAAARAADGVLL